MRPPDPTQQNAPTGGSRRSEDHRTGQSRHPHFTPVQTLLHALESVTGSPAKQAGKGWRSKCPSCGGRSHKVSIAAAENGGVLLHAFCGCDASTVLSACGLSMTDLMPTRDSTPEGRRSARAAMREASILCALEVLRHEARVVRIVAGDVTRGDVTATDLARCVLADQRIEQALGAINVRLR